jgi:hypothetical protein
VPADDLDLTIGPPGAPEVDVEAADVDEHQDYELGDGTPAPVISEKQVRDILDGAGRAFSLPPMNLGVADLWKFSSDELDGLTPPLTRVINKRPRLARAVAKGDEVFVLLQLVGYFGKRGDVVMAERRAARMEASNVDSQREDRFDAPRADPAAGAVVGATAVIGTDVGRSPAPEY